MDNGFGAFVAAYAAVMHFAFKVFDQLYEVCWLFHLAELVTL
jgi:hypothetical protein